MSDLPSEKSVPFLKKLYHFRLRANHFNRKAYYLYHFLRFLPNDNYSIDTNRYCFLFLLISSHETIDPHGSFFHGYGQEFATSFMGYWALLSGDRGWLEVSVAEMILIINEPVSLRVCMLDFAPYCFPLRYFDAIAWYTDTK